MTEIQEHNEIYRYHFISFIVLTIITLILLITLCILLFHGGNSIKEYRIICDCKTALGKMT